jgi:hypothetical protein
MMDTDHISGSSDLAARHRELCHQEEEAKREVTAANQKLTGIRELKRTIAQQIFNASNTTSTNGQTTNCLSRP